jgi:ribonuclease HI
LSINGICVGPAANNQAKYGVVIILLADALGYRICHHHVCIDSQLLIMQLNDVYYVCHPGLFKKYL